MSDKPLFPNTDEQESVFAPHELPEGSAEERRAGTEEGSGPDSDLTNVGLLPGAVAVGTNTGGTGPSTGAGTLSGVAPVAGGAALGDPAADQRDQDQRDEKRS